MCPQIAQNILRALQGNGEILVRLFDLVRGDGAGRVVGHRCGFDDDVALLAAGRDGLEHLLGRDDGHKFGIGRRHQVGGAGDQCHLRAAGRGCLGNGIAHFAGGAVGEIPHRVQRLPRGTGGHQNPETGHVLFVGQCVQNRLQKHLRLRHLSFADDSTGQSALRRLHQLPAVVPQPQQIILRHRIFIHPRVHGGRGDFGTVTGQNSGCQHVVRQAVGQLGQHIGRGGGNNDKVGLVRQGDMFRLMLKITVKSIDRDLVPSQGFKGQGRDELRGIARHEHMDIGMLLDQCGGKICRLIGRDAAADAKQYGFSFEHGKNTSISEVFSI